MNIIQFKKTIFSLLIFLFSSCFYLGTGKTVEITFQVQTTVQLEKGEIIYITGNHDQLGNWQPNAVPLDRISEDKWEIKLEFKYDTELEYKITCGNWNKEAIYDDCKIPGNSQLKVKNGKTVSLSIPKWKDDCVNIEGTVTGDVRYHRQFESQYLELPRDIVIWLPPNYEKSGLHYPVLYMHDGQNIFDPFTSSFGSDWQVDEVTTELIEQGKMNPIIVVGVYCTDQRTEEYSPIIKGAAYTKFFINELLPFIENNYRTLKGPENTAVMGSSMGGIISFHIAWENPDLFGMAGCLSPAFLVNDEEILKRVRNFSGQHKEIKFYLDNGTIGLEEEFAPSFNEIAAILRNKGYIDGVDLIYYVDEGAEHNEAAWAKRVHKPLLFFFGE